MDTGTTDFQPDDFRVRVIGEYVVSGVKRLRIVKDVLRNTKDGFAILSRKLLRDLHPGHADSYLPSGSLEATNNAMKSESSKKSLKKSPHPPLIGLVPRLSGTSVGLTVLTFTTARII